MSAENMLDFHTGLPVHTDLPENNHFKEVNDFFEKLFPDRDEREFKLKILSVSFCPIPFNERNELEKLVILERENKSKMKYSRKRCSKKW